jgi:hypothetical protein
MNHRCKYRQLTVHLCVNTFLKKLNNDNKNFAASLLNTDLGNILKFGKCIQNPKQLQLAK